MANIRHAEPAAAISRNQRTNFRSSLYPLCISPREPRGPFPNNRASSLCEFPPLVGSAATDTSRPRLRKSLRQFSTQRAARRGTEHSGIGSQRGSAPAAAVPSYGLRKNHPLVPHRHDTRLTCRRIVVKSESIPRLRDRSRASESSTSRRRYSVFRFSIKISHRVVGTRVNSERLTDPLIA